MNFGQSPFGVRLGVHFRLLFDLFMGGPCLSIVFLNIAIFQGMGPMMGGHILGTPDRLFLRKIELRR
jgi:hypothetical protein